MTTQTMEDLRERLTIQMYDWLALLVEAGNAVDAPRDTAKLVADLHRWWASQGQDLDAEIGRIRARLERERHAYAESAP